MFAIHAKKLLKFGVLLEKQKSCTRFRVQPNI